MMFEVFTALIFRVMTLRTFRLHIQSNRTYFKLNAWMVSLDNSLSIATSYRLDGKGSIPDREKRFSDIPQRPDRLWDPLSLLSSGPGGNATGGLKLATPLHLVLRSRALRLCPIRLHGVVLN
jgi:hypothetical protein